MNNTTLQLKVRQRLNKLASNDFENIPCWAIVEAFNKGMVEWVRRNLHGNNLYKEGDEQSTSRIDDFQRLIKTTPVLLMNNRQTFFETVNQIPADYLRFKRVAAKATKECCKDPHNLVIYLGEEANVEELLRDKNKKPSFEFAETFATFESNKLQIYTNEEFDIEDVKLTYYRQPIRIEINGCKDPYTGNIPTVDVECEFKDDQIELLIDECCKIIAGDIENILQVQREQQAVDNNN